MEPVRLIDTHSHLFMEPLGRDAPAVLARAAGRDVTQVVVPAYDPESWRSMAPLAGLPGVHLAFGLHPWVADADSDPGAPGRRNTVTGLNTADCDDQCSRLQRALTDVLENGRAVAIGEIGLDHKIDFGAGAPGPQRQRAILRAQLELAVDRDLPVILHCRGAFEELLTEIDRFGGRLRGVLHAFSRGIELGERYVAAGLTLGLGGAITRDRARRVRNAAAKLPLDRIVLETDSPSIGLDGVLPENTEPQHVRDVAEVLAGLRDEPLETIAEVTTANARELFRLPV